MGTLTMAVKHCRDNRFDAVGVYDYTDYLPDDDEDVDGGMVELLLNSDNNENDENIEELEELDIIVDDE